MIELIRIVQYQSLSSYHATQNEQRAKQLELLIEMTKPTDLYSEWHPLITSPFRYNPPHPQARFRPPYGKNVFYGSFIEETALYENAFHFIRERKHLNIKTDIGVRTIFSITGNENESIDIKKDPNCSVIMDKNDYSISHQYVISNPNTTLIIYPSCRDPQKRNNAAVLDINRLKKHPKWESSIKFFYDNEKQEISWLDYGLHIKWDEVS